MSETFKEQISRLQMMAAGNDTWDLSDNDCAAITAILQELKRLTTLRPASEWTEADGPVLWWRKQASGQMGEPTVAYMPLEEYGFDFWSRIPRVDVPR